MKLIITIDIDAEESGYTEDIICNDLENFTRDLITNGAENEEIGYTLLNVELE